MTVEEASRVLTEFDVSIRGLHFVVTHGLTNRETILMNWVRRRINDKMQLLVLEEELCNLNAARSAQVEACQNATEKPLSTGTDI